MKSITSTAPKSRARRVLTAGLAALAAIVGTLMIVLPGAGHASASTPTPMVTEAGTTHTTHKPAAFGATNPQPATADILTVAAKP